MSEDNHNNNDNRNHDDLKETQIPECACKECAIKLGQMKDISTHLSKMYTTINNCNQTTQNQNESLSRMYKELIPLLKSIDAKLKQNYTLLEKLSVDK